MCLFILNTCLNLQMPLKPLNVLTSLSSTFAGFSAGSNGSFAVLGLLGACTVCRCNQRHSPWKMAVFLMCLFFDNDELGLRGDDNMKLESAVSAV